MSRRLQIALLLLMLSAITTGALSQTITTVTTSGNTGSVAYVGASATGHRKIAFSSIDGTMRAYAVWNPGSTTSGFYYSTAPSPYTTWSTPTMINGTNTSTVSTGPLSCALFSDTPSGAGNLYFAYDAAGGHTQLQVFEPAGTITTPGTGYAWLTSPVTYGTAGGSTFGAVVSNGATAYARFIVTNSGNYDSYYTTNAINSSSAPTFSAKTNTIAYFNAQSAQVIDYQTYTMFISIGGANSSNPQINYNTMANNVTVNGTYLQSTAQIITDTAHSYALSETDLAAIADSAGNVHLVFNLGSGSTYTGGPGWYETIFVPNSGSPGTGTWSTPALISQMTYQDAEPTWTKDAAGNLYLTYCHYNATNDYGIAQLTEGSVTTSALVPATSTTVVGTVAMSATTITPVSTTGFPSTGTLTVGSITGVTYTGISGGQFTGVSGMSSAQTNPTITSLDIVTHNSVNRRYTSATKEDDGNLHGVVSWVEGTASPYNVKVVTFATKATATLAIGQLTAQAIDANHYGYPNGGPTLNTGNVTGGVAPYAYTVYRSTTSNFTPGSGNILTTLTGNSSGIVPSYQDGAGTLGLIYHYKIGVTDSASTTVYTNQLDAASATQEIRIMYIGASNMTNNPGGGNGFYPWQKASFDLAAMTNASVYTSNIYTSYPPGTNTNCMAYGGASTSQWTPTSGYIPSGGSVNLFNAAEAMAHTITGVQYFTYYGGVDDLPGSASSYGANLAAIGTQLMKDGFLFIISGPPAENNSLNVSLSATDANNAILQSYAAYIAPVGGSFTYTTPYYPTCTTSSAYTNGATTINVNATQYFNTGDGSFTSGGVTISYTGTTLTGSNITAFTGCTWTGSGNLSNGATLTSTRKVGVVAGSQLYQSTFLNNVANAGGSYYIDGTHPSALGAAAWGNMWAQAMYTNVLYPSGGTTTIIYGGAIIQ